MSAFATFSCWMVPRAASWLFQKLGSDCFASRASRAAVLAGMSKRVPQLGEPGAQFVGSRTEIGVHREYPSDGFGRQTCHPDYWTVAYRKRFNVRSPAVESRPARPQSGRAQKGRKRGARNVMGKLDGKVAV